MNLNRLLLPLGILSSLLTSCVYPYPPNPHAPMPGQSPDPVVGPPTVDSGDQQRIRNDRDAIRRRNADREPDEPKPPIEKPSGDSNPPPVRKDYRTGIPIPGKEGFVFNPFTNNPVDVRAIPPGTLVRDPQDSNPDHKFRVP